jgi:uroporphyrin-III C-methyltransferase
MSTNKQKLTIIGAGPGNPELITLKGAKALANADVILYDALVDKTLLEYAPKAEHIFVGKRKGNHALSQDLIHELILEKIRENKGVVRLKGGDPFVFGRGLEEMDFISKYGFETEYIPGISSSISVPGLQNIPVTHRGTSESFWVITGTTSEGYISEDLNLAAQSNATIVVLMGLGKLNEIVEIFASEGKDELPVAVIQNGSLPTEKVVVGQVFNIGDKVKEENIQAPAIIVLGGVVSLHPKFKADTVSYEPIYQTLNFD